MSRLNGFPPVPAVAEGVKRPFWSVMIPTYNPDLKFLTETIESVLRQDPGPSEMQIELVDDASPAFDPRAWLDDMRFSRVDFHRQPRHVGIGRNWNACLARSRGHWVHLLHQDDLILPGFYLRLRDGAGENPLIGAALCRHFVLGRRGWIRNSWVKQNRPGILTDWLEYVFAGLSFQCPAIVVRRSVYERLGGFDETFAYALDWDMWKRIAARYPLWFEPEALACYRRHRRSATGELGRTGQNIAEIRRSIESARSYLPPRIAADVTRRARRNYARYAVQQAKRLFVRQHDARAAMAQLREARRMSHVTTVTTLARVALQLIAEAAGFRGARRRARCAPALAAARRDL